MGISVLMSLYAKEQPAYVRTAVLSMVRQTRKADEIVLVEDGPLTEELYAVLEDVQKESDVPLVRVPLAKNSGLGIALFEGLKHCSQEYTARMDTDDIARADRLEIEAKYLDEHPDVAAIGSDIEEFQEEGVILSRKHMPCTYEEVYAYGKTRNPINHMTVMFRTDAVRQAGGYRHFPLLEDYDLWSRMLAMGMKIENIPEPLVAMRLGENFASRRGGREYFGQYKKLRRMQRDLGYTSQAEYYKALVLTFGMTRMPSQLRTLAYRRLRKQ